MIYINIYIYVRYTLTRAINNFWDSQEPASPVRGTRPRSIRSPCGAPRETAPTAAGVECRDPGPDEDSAAVYIFFMYIYI